VARPPKVIVAFPVPGETKEVPTTVVASLGKPHSMPAKAGDTNARATLITVRSDFILCFLSLLKLIEIDIITSSYGRAAPC
jgi:hypothetical protein